MLERLAKGNGEKIRIIKVDVTQSQNWARSENIRGIPTLQFYRAGSKVHEFSGAYPEQEMQRRIDKYALVAGGSASGADGETPQPVLQPMPKDWMPAGVSRK